jgi:hypothetical protein
MRGTQLICWTASIAALTLSACSDLGSGGDQTLPEANQQVVFDAGFVGPARCITCHETFPWSADIVAAYLAGKHVVHSTHISAANASDGCLECHDPIGAGRLLEGLIDAADVPEGGLAAVTCEECHGSGTDHYGIGPLPASSPDYTACGQCHNDDFFHNEYHPEADHIVEDYQTSRHATGLTLAVTTCVRCHSDEGARRYRDVQTRASLLSDALPLANGSQIQCRTCHDPHNVGNALLMDAVEEGSEVVYSAEYATCTNCHQGDNAAVTGDPADNLHDTLIFHEDQPAQVITDTHYDDPATTDRIEGYVVDRKGANVRSCLDCHAVHAVQEIHLGDGTSTINDQWAQSAHAGHLLTIKQEAMAGAPDQTPAQTQAMKEAGVPDTAPWVHYDWDSTDRQECQRCHTATGAKNFLDATATLNDDDPDNDVVYDPANNDFSHLDGWVADDPVTTTVDESVSSGQNELLYCWACHTHNTGALRNPGPVTPGYQGPDGVSDAVFPDVSGSNICVACHQGRASGGDIKADTGDFTDKAFINSHYLSAGGTVFRTTGYEYAGRDYADPPGFRHKEIGQGTQPDLAAWEAENGANGPCVGCHMSAAESHLYLPVETDGATGEITAITATVCVTCHGAAFAPRGGDALAQAGVGFVNRRADGLAAALQALAGQLAAVGHPFLGGYPYFAQSDWTNGGSYAGKDLMGAAFNFNLLAHDPGAYVHNSIYTRRLIYDSLDYLDNATLDGSVTNAIDSLVIDNQIDAATADRAVAYLDLDSDPGVQRP